MKRTISILVIVAMMLASLLAIVPVSAAEPEGTPVKNAKEFSAMEADGTYYLANDITISAPYGEFKGTFDGNGHTITVRGPMAFTKVNGATISNLNLVASVEADKPAAHVGALAGTGSATVTNVNAEVNYNYSGSVSGHVAAIIGDVTGTTVLENCTASGTINMPLEDLSNSETSAVGGLVAFVGSYSFTAKNCVNYVNIISNRERTNVGGILGQANGSYTVTIDACANYGTLTSTCTGNGGNVHCGSGGIVGQFSGNKVASKGVITNSRNYGDITTVAGKGAANKDKMVGGILGRIYGSDVVTIENCVNSGNIINVATGWGSSGGIIGQAETYNYSWSTNTKADIKINNCINLGNIGGNNCAGIFGSTAQIAAPELKFTISNCINYGEIDANTDGNGAGMFGATSDTANGTYTFINCYNAGKVDGAGIIAKLSQAAASSDSNAELGKQFGLVSIEGCFNVGEVTTGGLVGGYGGPALTIKASASTFADIALAPESEVITITETPEDVAAAAEALLATLPADPSELDVVIAENLKNEAVDYKEGWDVFKAAFDAAFAVAIKASTTEDMAAVAKALNDSLVSLVLNDELDFTELDIALCEANEFIDFEDDYLPATWAIFKAAFEAANACAEAERQSQINKAAVLLVQAIDELALKPDLVALDKELAKYTDIVPNEAQYTTASWAPFKAALDVATALKTDAAATGELVNEAIANLTAAAAALAKKVESTADLKAKVDDLMAKYVREAYTSDSYDVLNTLVRKANDAIASGDISAAEITALVEELDAAVAALEERADLTELKALVETVKDFVEENYEAEAWTAFKAALTAAQNAVKIGNDSKVSVEEGAALLADLKAAVDGLGGLADFTAIDALIAELAALVEADYTADSWKALQDAIAAATALKETAKTKAETDDALAAIKAAKDALKTAEKPTEKPTEVPTEVPTDVADEGGCGGFIATSVAVVTVVSVLGCAVVLKKKD